MSPFRLKSRVAFIPILLSEVEQEQRLGGNGDREAIVVVAGICDGEGERGYAVYDPILGSFKRFQMLFLFLDVIL